MYCQLTEVKEVIVGGQLQKHFNAIAFTDDSKTEVVAEQVLIVSGDALANPEEAFLLGLSTTTQDYVPTYSDNRVREYPAIESQLDDIFHNGIEGWKTSIQAVKDKHPRP